MSDPSPPSTAASTASFNSRSRATDMPGAPSIALIAESKAVDISTPIVKVIVGEDSEVFDIHPHILTFSSEFFKRAMKSEWTDLRSDPKEIVLIDDDPKTFKVYLHWMYFRTIPMPDGSKAGDIFEALVKAYVLGEKLMDINFKNDVLDAVMATQAKHMSFPRGDQVGVIYAGTGSSASLGRRLMVDFYADAANADENRNWLSQFKDCPKRLKVRPSLDKSPWLGARQKYHEVVPK